MTATTIYARGYWQLVGELAYPDDDDTPVADHARRDARGKDERSGDAI